MRAAGAPLFPPFGPDERAKITGANLKLARYRATIGAGGGPEEIGKWITGPEPSGQGRGRTSPGHEPEHHDPASKVDELMESPAAWVARAGWPDVDAELLSDLAAVRQIPAGWSAGT